MSRKSSIDDLNLESVSGRLAYAIKTKGPSFVEKQTSLSRAQVSRLSNEQTSTTLENAADIAQATGFELKWIALGEGPMMVSEELWEHTNTFQKVSELDSNQKLDLSFGPDFLEKQNVSAEQCRVWEIDSHVSLTEIKRGYMVLIDTKQVKGSGVFVLENNNEKLIGELLINLDGSAKFITNSEKADTDQTLTKEQLDNLNIIGRVIWHGGHS